MATTIRLYVIEAPLTIDHLILAVSGTPDSGFFETQNVWDHLSGDEPFERDGARHKELLALDEPMRLRIEAARAAVEANDACAAAMTARFGPESADVDPDMHLHWLAPDLRLGESFQFPEGTPLWALGEIVLIDSRAIRNLVGAVASAIADPRTEHPEDMARPEDVRTFLNSHIGKPMLIGRD